MAPWLRSQQDLEEVLSDRDSFPPQGLYRSKQGVRKSGGPPA